MEDVRFDRPVRILTGRAFSVSMIVDTTLEAADYLVHKWPVGTTGPKHLQAKISCMNALTDIPDGRAVREAFEAAADEAGILVKQP